MSSSGRLLASRPLLRWGVGVGVAALLVSGPAFGRERPAGIGSVSFGELPVEARAVERQIRAGGPFAYAKDGIVFANREQMLPREPRGYYHEYTVPTPGARDRGARRIVCGGEAKATPKDCFYSNDHYTSFKRITP